MEKPRIASFAGELILAKAGRAQYLWHSPTGEQAVARVEVVAGSARLSAGYGTQATQPTAKGVYGATEVVHMHGAWISAEAEVENTLIRYELRSGGAC
jgi:hypothetical protein